MKKPVFEGVATALVTPFKNGTIDLPTLQKLMDRQIGSGTDAIVVCGTTGESATLTTQEQLSLISHAVDYAAGRCKIIAGTGSNSTAHALEMSRMAASVGADALLLVTPYYNKCTQSGLIEHYTTIADQVKTPVIVYNVPSRTGMDITLETYKTLSEHPNINGVKEAGPSIAKGRTDTRRLRRRAECLVGQRRFRRSAALHRRKGPHLRTFQRPPGADAGYGQERAARRLCAGGQAPARADAAHRRTFL